MDKPLTGDSLQLISVLTHIHTRPCEELSSLLAPVYDRRERNFTRGEEVLRVCAQVKSTKVKALTHSTYSASSFTASMTHMWIIITEASIIKASTRNFSPISSLYIYYFFLRKEESITFVQKTHKMKVSHHRPMI